LAVKQRRPDAGHSCAPSVKLPKTDGFLEDMLVNNIEIVEPLSGRETQILRFIVSGRTNKEIGRILCRSERTVEYHRNRLMGKLGAHNAAGLVRRAIAMGIT
jgi:DNA-binding NarL/FixJ family response regulator